MVYFVTKDSKCSFFETVCGIRLITLDKRRGLGNFARLLVSAIDIIMKFSEDRKTDMNDDPVSYGIGHRYTRRDRVRYN